MKKLTTYQIEHLIHYTVNRIITKEIENFKEFRELEKSAIIARIITITTSKKKNPTQEQVLQVIYNQLGVQNIWKTLNGLQFTS